ncbi:MAG TPA: hypothetical protein VIL09_07135 [Microvirga sp.]|jgi:hypothetical protein
MPTLFSDTGLSLRKRAALNAIVGPFPGGPLKPPAREPGLLDLP